MRFARKYMPGRRGSACTLALILAGASGWYAGTSAAPYVEFDFARAIECRDVTPPHRLSSAQNVRLVEVLLPISVRFHGLTMDDVEQLDIEINGAAAALRVHDFAPCTILSSDIADPIETTTTTKRNRSLSGTLGGALPVPAGSLVANVTPSLTASLGKCETATEKLKRLAPKHAVVVSGTSSEGCGVFYKLKRSSQTSLEGVHELAITFIAPAKWRGANLQVTCSAQGERKVLWMKQDATLGSERSAVRLVLASMPATRQVVLKPAVNSAEHTAKGPAAIPKRGAWRTAEMLDEVAAKAEAVEISASSDDSQLPIEEHVD
jgi:hypothetical protein